MSELPLVRALRGEVVNEVEIFVRNPLLPAGAWLSFNGHLFQGDDSPLDGGAIVVFRDISSRKRLDEALHTAKVELESKVSELALLNNELVEAKDQAQAASKFKSEFVANMSHEIRTPMNGIIGMCNVLLKTISDERQRGYAGAIKDAGNALLTVINDILDFSKIEAGKIELELVEFDPVRVVEGTCEILATQARAKHLSLMSFVDPMMPTRLLGDPERVRQVLFNLTSNAIKFAQSGEIVVKALVDSRQGNVVNVLFCVIDKGMGLTLEEQQRLFQPFVQADGSISRKFGGTGLGLSISKRFVELMDGTMGLESEKGKGSTFWCVVPFELRSEVSKVRTIDELRNVRILTVDDEPYAQEILHNYVLSWGMRNGVAGSADEGIRKLKQAYMDGDPYSAAIIDLVMVGKSGIDMAKEILNDPALSSTKLILLTAFDTPGLGTQAIELGFKAYITKPVRQSQMLDCLLEVVCGGRQLITKATADAKPQKVLGQKSARSELILVVEDHAINQQVAQLYLNELGFACDIASDGREAVDAVNEIDYSLVFMDCQMPEMDGLAATGLIRKAELLSGKHIPIIAMTAHAMEGDRDKCIAVGMDDYISKPVDPDQLRLVLEKWLPLPAALQAIDASMDESISSPISIEKLEDKYGAHNVDRFIDLFIADAQIQIDKLKQAFNSSNASELLSCAHGFKGICSTVFALPMKQLCADIEIAGREKDWNTLSVLLDQLEQEFERLQQTFRH